MKPQSQEFVGVLQRIEVPTVSNLKMIGKKRIGKIDVPVTGSQVFTVECKFVSMEWRAR